MSITVQCFVLCRSVTKEPGGLQTIERIFDQTFTSRFPVKQACALHVRFVISDRPKCTVCIVLESPTLVKGQILAPVPVNPNPNGLVQLTCNLKELVLPVEGIYTFRLLVDEKVCSVYYLAVVKRRERKAAQPPPASSNE